MCSGCGGSSCSTALSWEGAPSFPDTLPPVTLPRVTARPAGISLGGGRSDTSPAFQLSLEGPSRSGPHYDHPLDVCAAAGSLAAQPPLSRRGTDRGSPPGRIGGARGAGPLLPGAYPPPPPTRCSRPASLRRSPKHCVQQQFPIACRPGVAAPPPPTQSPNPGPEAASARHEPNGDSGAKGGPAGARRPGGKGDGRNKDRDYSCGRRVAAARGRRAGQGLDSLAVRMAPRSPQPPSPVRVTASRCRRRAVPALRRAQAGASPPTPPHPRPLPGPNRPFPRPPRLLRRLSLTSLPPTPACAGEFLSVFCSVGP